MRSAAPPAPPDDSSSQSRTSVGLSAATGRGIGSPARAGTPLESFAPIFRRQRQAWQAAVLDGLRQFDDQADQLTLKGDGRSSRAAP